MSDCFRFTLFIMDNRIWLKLIFFVRLQSKKNLLSCQESTEQQILSPPAASADKNGSKSPQKAVTTTTTVLTNQTTATEELSTTNGSCTEQLTARSAQLSIQSEAVTSQEAVDGAVRRLQMNSKEKLIINQTKIESPRSPVKVIHIFLFCVS